MSKIGTINLKGCSGIDYTFDIYPITTAFKPLSGIYYISRFDSAGNHSNIYLGITENLATRFVNHHKRDCFIQHSANCISILLQNSEKRRIDIEEDILCNYSFPCNSQLN